MVPKWVPKSIFVPMASAAVVGFDFGAIWDDFGVHVATILEAKIDTEAS